jgi:hypothetical protein
MMRRTFLLALIVSGAFFLLVSGIASAGWDYGMESSTIETSEFETEEGAGTGNILPESGIAPEGSFREEGPTVESFP